jgi:TatD DNase family protein
VIERARRAGVTGIVVTGTSVQGSAQAVTVARGQPGYLWATAGVHPHDAKSCDEGTVAALTELARDDLVVAVGECGLDFNRDFSPRPVQETWFEAQLSLAADLGLPVFLHERDAATRFSEILAPWMTRLPGAVVHCFTGDEDALKRYLDMGCHVGVTGWICDERRGVRLRELVGRVPADRLMAETDAPYLMPRDLVPKPRTRRNEPSHLPHIVRTIAACAGRPFEEVAEQTARVASAFFGLA